MELLEKLLVVFDLTLGIFDAQLQVQEEVSALDLVETLLDTLMLFQEVFYRFVSIFDLLLPSTHFHRPRTLSLAIGELLFLEALLIHLVNESVDTVTHLLELVSQLLVLSLQILLLLRVITGVCLQNLRGLPHSVQALSGLNERSLNEPVWVPLLCYDNRSRLWLR